MKLVYIGDNRCRSNFGCRGTSIALSQLISREHTIVGTISGAHTLRTRGPLFFVPGLPSWIYYILVRIPGWLIFRNIWCGRFSRYGATDFVSDSPEKSISNLKRCLDANPHLNELDLRRYDSEGIIINGEGTMILTTPPRRDALIYLMFIKWAKDLGKKIYFVNAMFSDCPSTGVNDVTKKQWLHNCNI